MSISNPQGSTHRRDGGFLPHVNGLRALAILGIVFYHLNAAYCPAGYLGVDVFLVISGYFLLSGLTDPAKLAGFSYKAYFTRKAWRILPSMFIVGALVSLVAALTMEAPLPKNVFKIAFTHGYLAANCFIDHLGGYFNERSSQNPLLHFWYLGLTLQLYLAAPLLLVPAARKYSRRALDAGLGVIALLSFLYFVAVNTEFLPWHCRHTLSAALGMESPYYHLFPRLWEIIAGYSILRLPVAPKLGRHLAILGLLLCVAPFFVLGRASSCSCLTVCGAMLLIRYGAEGGTGKLLGSAPLQFLGTLSFPLYLLHWPVMVFWKYVDVYQPGLGEEVCMLAAALSASCLLGKWADHLARKYSKGVRTGKSRVLRYSLMWLPPAALLACGACLARGAILHLTAPPAMEFPLLQKGYPSGVFEKGPCALGDDPSLSPKFLLLGDSHAKQLEEGFRDLCSARKTMGCLLDHSCTPYRGYYLPRYVKGDADWNSRMADALAAYLKEQKSIRYVLIAQRWERRLQRDRGYDERTMSPLPPERRLDFVSDALRKTCDELRALGKEVVLLADTPIFPQPSPLDEYRRCERFGKPLPHRVLSRREHRDNNRIPDALMRELLAEGRVRAVIDMSAPLMHGGVCAAEQDGEFLFWDTDHLLPKGSGIVAEYILDALDALDARSK